MLNVVTLNVVLSVSWCPQALSRRHDIQHNGIQHNNKKHDTQQNDLE